MHHLNVLTLFTQQTSDAELDNLFKRQSVENIKNHTTHTFPMLFIFLRMRITKLVSDLLLMLVSFKFVSRAYKITFSLKTGIIRCHFAEKGK